MRLELLSAGVALAMTVAACGGAPGPGEPGYEFNLDGEYDLEVQASDGTTYSGLMMLETGAGGAVSGTMALDDPVVINATVDGLIIGSQFTFSMPYEILQDGCTGLASGTAVVGDGGTDAEGELEITDDSCGGAPPSATISLRRQGSG